MRRSVVGSCAWAILLVATVGHGACLNGHPSVAKEYHDSTAVVVATVLAQRLIPSSDNEFYQGTLYQIRMEKRFRGDFEEKADIFSENSSGRFPMKVGSRYLLFIYTANMRMLVDYCGNSGLLSRRLKELAEIERLAGARTDTSQWKILSSRSGWSIKYPGNWRITSCRQCEDPQSSGVFVAFQNPSTNEIIMVEPLQDKPAGSTVEQWLTEVKVSANLNPEINEQWIALGGVKALKVITRSPDSKESENIYVIHGSKTFAIRAERKAASYEAYQRMLSTFRFTTVK